MASRDDVIKLLREGYTQRYVSRELRVPKRRVGEIARANHVGRRAGETRADVLAKRTEADILLKFALSK